MSLFWVGVLALAGSWGEWGDRPGPGGNPWGPAATLARARGELPGVPVDRGMATWERWGRSHLRDGDIVFRLGDVRLLGGTFPLSWFIARATGSPFSHVGLVAVESEAEGPVVYQCVGAGVQRQPFAVWMRDNHGAFGAKRLRAEERGRIPGALAFARRLFAAQVPFDRGFRIDDEERFYCVEFVEKAFRAQGLALSEPVRIGDWRNLAQFPLTTTLFLAGSRLALDRPIALDQPVYVPGDDREGLWASPRLETVARVASDPAHDTSRPMPGGLGVRGDAAIGLFLARELRSVDRSLGTALGLVAR